MNETKELIEYVISSSRVNSDASRHVDINVKHEIEQFIEKSSVQIILKLKEDAIT